MQISEKSIAAEVLRKYKKTASVFKSYNLKCPSCKGVEQDTIGQIIINNGLDPKKFMEKLKEAAVSEK